MALHITIADTRLAVVRNLRYALESLVPLLRGRVQIDIVHGSVTECDAPGVCYVNGGNAYGIMRGKLDATLLRLMPRVDEDVRAMIAAWGATARDNTKHLPLFSAVLSRANQRWLITAPCMYHPGPQNFRGTRNAFHATRTALAMLISANRAGMDIKRVVMSGMCTGHGRMNRRDAAAQMADAFRAVFVDDNMPLDPSQAQHPRMIIDSHHAQHQPVVEKHDVFIPRTVYMDARGTRHLRAPEPETLKTQRSGGSQEASPFINL